MKNLLAYKYYYFPVLILVIVGIVDTAYLGISHYLNYTDIAYESFCAISKTINCDTVSQSPWSIIFGIPVALWGLTGYLFYLSILIFIQKNTEDRIPLWSILQLLGFIYSIVAIILAVISATKIHSYCIMCILSYGISFLLFFYPWFIRKRFDKNTFFENISKSLLIVKNNIFPKFLIIYFIILIIGLKLFLPQYWILQYPSNYSNLSTGITEDGNPWIGSEKSKFIIEEFTDYQCFQCSKFHYFLRKLIEQYPDRIKLIHHHYPLDHRYNPILNGKPFHNGSGEMSLLAIYATSKGKFWEMNDELYRLPQTGNQKIIDLKTLAAKLSLPERELRASLSTPSFRQKLDLDLQQGIRAGITGTPAYIINGKTYQGSIPSDILKEIMQ